MNALEQHGDLLRSLASLVFEAADTQFGEGNWDAAFHDVRFSADGNSWLRRTVVRAGDHREMVRLSTDATVCEEKLWELRPKIAKSDWYGLLISIASDGTCETNYDYDLRCLERFAEDEKARNPF